MIKKNLIRVVAFSLAVFLFVLVLGATGYFSIKFFNDFLDRPIQHVDIQGELNHLEKSQLLLEVENHLTTSSFIKENLSDIQSVLEAHPWVDEVHLRRQWPDKLLVKIIEQRPIARWEKIGFLNHRGELIRLEKHSKLDQLPVLVGSPENSRELMRQYQDLSLILGRYDLKLDKLEKKLLGSWRIYLDNGWSIITGQNDSIKKIQKLMIMVSENKIDHLNNVSVFDLRYENGLAVRWTAIPKLTVNVDGYLE